MQNSPNLMFGLFLKPVFLNQNQGILMVISSVTVSLKVTLLLC